MSNEFKLVPVEPDHIHQMAFEEGQPAENGDGYLFTSEEFDLFVGRLLTAASHQPPALGGEPEVYALDFDLDAAARKLADRMDYPWEHMPEAGRNSMRAHAKAVIDAALSKPAGSEKV